MLDPLQFYCRVLCNGMKTRFRMVMIAHPGPGIGFHKRFMWRIIIPPTACTCFGLSPPTQGCHPPPSTGNHTPPPSPGLVPSLSMPSLPPPPRATLMSSCCAHAPARFGQHHPLGPPLLNLPPGCSPTSPSRSLLTTCASTAGEPLKTCSVWGAVPHVSFFCRFLLTFCSTTAGELL